MAFDFSHCFLCGIMIVVLFPFHRTGMGQKLNFFLKVSVWNSLSVAHKKIEKCYKVNDDDDAPPDADDDDNTNIT